MCLAKSWLRKLPAVNENSEFVLRAVTYGYNMSPVVCLSLNYYYHYYYLLLLLFKRLLICDGFIQLFLQTGEG